MVQSDIEAAKAGKIFANTYLDWWEEKGHDVNVNGSGTHVSSSSSTNGLGSGIGCHNSGVNRFDVNGNDDYDTKGKEFTSEDFLVDDHGSKAPTRVSCRWRFSNTGTNVYALRQFHCLDLLITIIPKYCASDECKGHGNEEVFPNATGTALERLVNSISTSRPRATGIEIATKVVLVPRNGYLCRSDILELRVQHSDYVDSFVRFPSANSYFPAVTHSKRDLLNILSSSPGTMLMKQVPTTLCDTFELLEEDLGRRLSLDWVLPSKPPERRVALVGGRYKYDIKQGSFGHKGTFDAAHSLGISVVVVDKPGHWLQEDDYSDLREEFIAVDMTDDTELPSRIAGALGGRDIDGVVTFSDEVVIPTAKVAEIMGLPTDPVQSFLQAHDKFEARKLLSPNVQSLRLDSAHQLSHRSTAEKMRTLKYPLVVKPSTGAGSRGVKKVDDCMSAWKAIQQVEEDGLAKRGILVETFIDGPEVDANFVLWDGEILFFEVVDDLPCQADASDAKVSDNFAETILIAPSQLDPSEIQVIQSTLHRSLLQLGFRSGVFHVEARMEHSSKQYREIDGIVDLVDADSASKRPPEVFLIEVNARAPGLMAVFATAYTYGVDYSALTLLRALGDRERFTALSKPFSQHAQYWNGLVLIPVHRDNIVVPDDFCNKVMQRAPDIAPHVSRSECLATGKVISPVGGTGFMGYFLVFSRISRQHVVEMSQRVREVAKQLLDSV
ncbi:glutathione synthetase ATP-binding domain-like protein [Polychaeton citri CBS 116435]|uniref:Glutathione synthetase ATP-binding domain-like protein n=1 Tax=Polychaeton citri CBS 116435 TaxID=1314669 RepID=A0A9P4UQG2_9PEZI|nr:glutathione synthetase ATP-binding domain-like protein [Polychaeton citri CBS 116435]